jgi:hypothetical protein
MKGYKMDKYYVKEIDGKFGVFHKTKDNELTLIAHFLKKKEAIKFYKSLKNMINFRRKD